MIPIKTNIFENLEYINEDFVDSSDNITSLNELFTTSILDYRLWQLYSPSPKTTYTLGNSKLLINHLGNANYVSPFYIKSNNILVGNFSIQFNYSGQVGFSIINSTVCSILLTSKKNPTTHKIEFGKFKASSGFSFQLKITNDGVNNTPIALADSGVLSGSIRLVRNENILIGYALINSEWKIVEKIDISGFNDSLEFSIQSAALASNSGSIAISNISINKAPTALGDTFSTPLTINLDSWDINLIGTSTASIVGGALSLGATATTASSNTITRFGVTDSNFSSEINFASITGTGVGAKLCELALYNYYSNASKNGLGIRYIAGASAPANTIEFYKTLSGVETIISTTTLNSTNFFLKLTRTNNDFEGFYKLSGEDDWISLGTFTSTALNNFKSWVISIQKASSGSSVSVKGDNFFTSASRYINISEQTRYSLLNNINRKYFKLSSNIYGGITYHNGLIMSISNDITSECILSSLFNLQGNFQMQFGFDKIKLPSLSSSYLEISFSPYINPDDKKASIRISHNNDYTDSSSNLQYLTAQTIDSSTTLSTIELNREKFYIRITKIDFSLFRYEYSLDEVNWTIIDTEHDFVDTEDMVLNISLKNNQEEIIGSSVKLLYFKTNFIPGIVSFNPVSSSDYRIKNNSFTNIYDSIMNNDITLNNFISESNINTGIFRKESIDKSNIGSMLGNSFNFEWEEITKTSVTADFTGYSSIIGSNDTATNHLKVAYNSNSSTYQIKNKLSFTQGTYDLSFIPTGINSNKTVGTTFCRLLFMLEDGSGFDIKLKSNVTPHKQDIVSDSYTNYNYVTPSGATTTLKADFTSITNFLTTFRIIYSSSSVTLKYMINQSEEYIDVISYSITDSSVLAKMLVEVKNISSTNTGSVTFANLVSNTNPTLRNRNLLFNPILLQYGTLSNSLLNNRNKFTIHIICSTFKDPATARTLYAEYTTENLVLIQKTISNTFKITLKNHLGNNITIQSTAKDFSISKDWLISITFSKANGYKLYVNGVLAGSLNNGSESALIYTPTTIAIGKDFTGNYFKGKLHQINTLEKEESAETIKEYYDSTKPFLTKKLFILGDYI